MTLQVLSLESESYDSGITEIVMPPISHGNSDCLVLPMLAHLSQQCKNEWFTWIAPQNVTKSLLDSYGFARDKVRLIHTKGDDASLWVFWSSLANGNSGTVVAGLSNLLEKDRQQLESASSKGKTRGIVLRHR